MFTGRQKELDILEEHFTKNRGQITVVYGRRRIGKSALIKQFCKGKNSLLLEGLENERTPKQIQHVVDQLHKQLQNKFLKGITVKTWDAVFSYLTDRLVDQKKLVLVFDELQWLAARQTSLISVIKFYWDNHWKEKNVFLILCGSISTYMINKIIKSKALYGRIDHEMHIRALMPQEAKKMISGRSDEEVIKYLMLFGGVPKYLEIINARQSFEKNIEKLCFTSGGFMVDEFEKIFFSQFPEAQSYLSIIKTLSATRLTFNEIAKKTRIPSGGGLRQYLNNLIKADFIEEQKSFGATPNSYLKKYQVTDEYLRLFFKYIEPFTDAIHRETNEHIFQKAIKAQWLPWLGLAFERFCLKHAVYLAKLMGFADDLIEYAPWFCRDRPGCQIDLVYRRLDKVIVICEIKFHEQEIDTKIIPEIEAKIKQFPLPKGFALEKALISTYGPTPALRSSEYFHYQVCLHDILNPKHSS